MVEAVYVSRKEVCKMLTISPSTLDRLIQRGDFPQGIKLSLKKVVWEKSVVQSFIESKRQN